MAIPLDTHSPPEGRGTFQLVFNGDDFQKHKSISSTVLFERWKKSKPVAPEEKRGEEQASPNVGKEATEGLEDGEDKARLRLEKMEHVLGKDFPQQLREQMKTIFALENRKIEQQLEKIKKREEDLAKKEAETRAAEAKAAADKAAGIRFEGISLGDIRKIIALSGKSFFCLQDRSHLVEEETTLDHYLALTSQSTTESNSVSQVTIYYTNKKTSSADTRKERKEAVAKQLELVQELKTSDFTDPGTKSKLGELSSLYTKDLLDSSDYATTSDSTIFSHPEEMTAADWDNVMRANSLLHGTYTKSTSVGGQRARKPIFQKKAVQQKHGQNQSWIPSFSICDNSNISVDESATEQKTSLLKSGFTGWSAEASISGGVGAWSGSASGSASGSKATHDENQQAKAVTDITISYKFPRVELYLDELDQEGYELTNECMEALERIEKSRSMEDVYAFYEGYGHFFAVTVRLGGRLTSTHHISKESTESLSEVKNRLKVAAALSISGPSFAMSTKGSYEHNDNKVDTDSKTSHNDKLAWEATGGDTTLASNPAAWAPTVRSYHNWRVTEITKVVPITQVLSTMVAKKDYYGLFREIEYPLLVSIGDPHFEMPSVALVQDAGSTFRLYYQDADGIVWECIRDGTTNKTIGHRSVTKARRNSPLIAWNNPVYKPSASNYIRIIFVNHYGYLDELIYTDQDYTPGHLGNFKIKLTEGHHIAGTSWGMGAKAEACLFYQDREHNLCHLRYNQGDSAGWRQHPMPLMRGIVPKTPLAAGRQKAESQSGREVPFVLFLRTGKDSINTLYDLHVVGEDRLYQNHWYSEKLPDASFAVDSKFTVLNTLRDETVDIFYWLESGVNGEGYQDPENSLGNHSVVSIGSGRKAVSIAAAQSLSEKTTSE
ncbi:hypothetical protein AARAC_011902 [Aspergillus arachidicola]|uniref:MACPF-like domain-containing protein n=1 Tax=Aspergillus arachidicola TaxID=656916 RepID=A0A2G7G232_9EURO|nr:hypothetical protein AARAC_011902 [Aspergillus arachidicola]